MSPRKKKKLTLFDISKKLVQSIPTEVFRITIAIIVVLGLTWGIAKATENELESATDNFSVIGTVSSISDETLSLIDARGTDTKEEELYNLNITYLDRVETKEYQPLIISDIKPGDTIVAQGVTNGTKFFIKRIVSFSTAPLPVEEEATTTPDVVATSTEDTASTTPDVNSETEDTPPTEQSTTSLPVQEEATTTPDVVATSTEDTASSTPIIETITEIIENGLDQVSDVLDTVIDTVTGTEESQQPVPEVVAEPSS